MLEEEYEDDREQCYIFSFLDQDNKEWIIDFFHQMAIEEVADALYADRSTIAMNNFVGTLRNLVGEAEGESNEIKLVYVQEYKALPELKRPFYWEGEMNTITNY